MDRQTARSLMLIGSDKTDAENDRRDETELELQAITSRRSGVHLPPADPKLRSKEERKRLKAQNFSSKKLTRENEKVQKSKAIVVQILKINAFFGGRRGQGPNAPPGSPAIRSFDFTSFRRFESDHHTWLSARSCGMQTV